MATYYCDGSTYANGQPRQDSSYIVLCPDGLEIREHIGNHSINVAELSAILHASTLAGPGDEIVTDSLICYNWIRKWKPTKNNGHVERDVRTVQRIVASKGVTVRWVGREENLAGIRLEEEPFYS